MTTYPKRLFPTYRDTDSTQKYYTLLPDIYSAGNNMGLMSRSLEKYFGDFSSYVQSLLGKDASEVTSSDNIWFAPVYDYKDNNEQVYYYANSDYYYVGKINGPTAEIAPTIKLVYSIID